MAFKRKSYPVHRGDIELFAKHTVVLVVLIEAGYITHWPHEWTRDGNRSRRRATIEGQGYDANRVFQDANTRLYYAGQPQGVTIRNGDDGWQGLNETWRQLHRMKGEIADAEAID